MRHYNKHAIAPVILTFETIFYAEIVKPITQPTPWLKRSTLGVSCKIRNDFSDMDYAHKLDKNALNFLKAFNREYYNADLKHKYKKLHKSKKHRKSVYDLNNEKNRDVYALLKCRGMLLLAGCNPELIESNILKKLWNKNASKKY